jgi:hypothetical protein
MEKILIRGGKNSDPGWKKFGSGVRDGKFSDPGSRKKKFGSGIQDKNSDPGYKKLGSGISDTDSHLPRVMSVMKISEPVAEAAAMVVSASPA